MFSINRYYNKLFALEKEMRDYIDKIIGIYKDLFKNISSKRIFLKNIIWINNKENYALLMGRDGFCVIDYKKWRKKEKYDRMGYSYSPHSIKLNDRRYFHLVYFIPYEDLARIKDIKKYNRAKKFIIIINNILYHEDLDFFYVRKKLGLYNLDKSVIVNHDKEFINKLIKDVRLRIGRLKKAYKSLLKEFSSYIIMKKL